MAQRQRLGGQAEPKAEPVDLSEGSIPRPMGEGPLPGATSGGGEAGDGGQGTVHDMTAPAADGSIDSDLSSASGSDEETAGEDVVSPASRSFRSIPKQLPKAKEEPR